MAFIIRKQSGSVFLKKHVKCLHCLNFEVELFKNLCNLSEPSDATNIFVEDAIKQHHNYLNILLHPCFTLMKKTLKKNPASLSSAVLGLRWFDYFAQCYLVTKDSMLFFLCVWFDKVPQNESFHDFQGRLSQRKRDSFLLTLITDLF